MTAPLVTEIKFAPSRIGDFENFAGERAIFLAALSNFRTQSNALKIYLNALPIQVRNNDYGRLNEPADPSASITLLPTLPTGGDSSMQRTIKSDGAVSATRSAPESQNLVSTYADFFTSGSFVVDGTRPVIPDITIAPSPLDSEATFESRSITFFASVKDCVVKLKDLSTYFYNKVYPGPDEDYGLITEAVTSTVDFGTVP